MKAYYGNFVDTPHFGEINTFTGYLFEDHGVIVGKGVDLPDGYRGEVVDFGNALIIPPFCDVHLHAGQYENIGVGYDYQLLEWLEKYTYPTEKKFYDLMYSKEIYARLLEDMWERGTLNFISMCTASTDSTALFMDMIGESGLRAYVGKRNTDFQVTTTSNEDTQTSFSGALYLLHEKGNLYENVKYILSPSFVPGCTEEMLELIGNLSEERNVPVQSHLDETLSEIDLVMKRFPEAESYASVYEKYHIIGKSKTIMAHCNYVKKSEIELLKKYHVFVAHCPTSNLDLGSGVMPLRKLKNEGISVGLGSDISGGHTLNMMTVIKTAIEVSKLRYLANKEDKPINMAEALFLATKGGGEFWGKIGCFEEGYPFDALVIHDEDRKDLSIKERLEKFIYSGEYKKIKERYLNGLKIEKPKFS